MVTKSTVRRARSAESKERRAADLADAARALATSRGVRNVTLAAIAEDAGVHPSAVRRYFDSREDILLRLAGEAWQEWAASVTGELARLSSGAQVGGVLARSLAERPLFCDLLAHASLTLEREVPLESARSFKVAALDAAEAVAEAIGCVDAALAGQAAWDVVAAASALGAMLWQYADPPEVLQRLYAEDPRLAHTVDDFVPRLTRLLDQLIAGANCGAGHKP